jgi:hypothetical protein
MTLTTMTENIHPQVSFLEDPGRYQGILSWILTRDHKRIGILYLVLVTAFFFSGVILGFFMRLQMIAPGGAIMGPQTYNALFTLHGIIMIFLVVIPVIPTVFGNFFLPIQIGARDVAFPRINLLSWWLYLSGAGFMASLQLRTRALIISTMPIVSENVGLSPSCIHAVRTPTTGAPSIPNPVIPAGNWLKA